METTSAERAREVFRLLEDGKLQITYGRRSRNRLIAHYLMALLFIASSSAFLTMHPEPSVIYVLLFGIGILLLMDALFLSGSIGSGVEVSRDFLRKRKGDKEVLIRVDDVTRVLKLPTWIIFIDKRKQRVAVNVLWERFCEFWDLLSMGKHLCSKSEVKKLEAKIDASNRISDLMRIGKGPSSNGSRETH